MAILDQKVTRGAPTMVDAFGAGVVKYFEERLIARTPLGNGNVVSGLVKLGGGYAAHKLAGGGFVGNSLSLGFTVDGVEDILSAAFSGNLIPGFALGGSGSGRPAWAN